MITKPATIKHRAETISSSPKCISEKILTGKVVNPGGLTMMETLSSPKHKINDNTPLIKKLLSIKGIITPRKVCGWDEPETRAAFAND